MWAARGGWGWARADRVIHPRGTHLYATEVPGREKHHTLPQAGHVPLQCLKHGAIGACAMGAQAPGKDLPVGRGNKTTAHFHGISLKNTASLCQNHRTTPRSPPPCPILPPLRYSQAGRGAAWPVQRGDFCWGGRPLYYPMTDKSNSKKVSLPPSPFHRGQECSLLWGL